MKRLLFWGCTSILLGFISCTNELPFDITESTTDVILTQEEFHPNEEMIQLGKKLENPYSVTSMRKAFELLPTESRGEMTLEDIQPTHLYVKFKPKDVDELDAMFWSDPTIDFYAYPLDYERTTGGYYHDPSLPEDIPTYHYASIPINHPIPQVCDYEILEQLYIPDEQSEYTRSLPVVFINSIVKQAFEITGNKYEGDAVATRSDGQTRASYVYSGTIKAYDDLMNTHIPVPGAVIKCTRWFTTVKGLTDINGQYSVTRESTNEYNYAIYWERDYKYDIREGELNQAVTDGPKQTAGWSVNMGRDNGYPRGVNFAAITRAARRYFYGNTGGLDSAQPMATGDLKICYMHNEAHEDGWSGYFSTDVSFELTGDIYIYSLDSDENIVTTPYIYATSVHEMGHSTLCAAVTRDEYLNIDKLLRESWSEFIEGYLTYIEYGELGKYNTEVFSFEHYCKTSTYRFGIYNALRWPKESRDNYSSLIIDLYDNLNQREYWVDEELPNDVITGYSPSILNSMMKQCYDLEDIRAYLKLYKPSNVTNSQIDDYINFYINVINS